MKGRGFAFQAAVHRSIATVNSRTERCAERCSHLVVSSENQRSTRFSHDEEVGTKWKWKWK
jgi:hypothetical protein